METRIEKCGDGLAIRIPESVAERCNLVVDQLVTITVIGKDLNISTRGNPSATLDELLAGITEDNLHEEVDFGPPVGRENW